ncbi:MAG TPA: hypothetical protein VKC61_13415 [Pyrinomonadaceae bacterium]|nr:hypothetical protein [Pyrinomonadaceae bacterium]
MKKTASALVLIVICSLSLHGQDKGPASKQPVEWSFSLNTGGAPWYKKFNVELNQIGNFIVTEDDPNNMPNPTTSKVTIKLSINDAQEIYEQTFKAFREFGSKEKKVERADGTNLRLQLSANGRVQVMQFSHMGQIEEESMEVAKLLLLINKHLSKDHQVY